MMRAGSAGRISGRSYRNSYDKSLAAAVRLSCTLDDPPGAPAVYVTWELRDVDDGTVIRLHVDEPWPLAGAADDLETAWLPVISALVEHLEHGSASRPGKAK